MFFFFNDTATTEIYTLSLHDALPIFERLLGAPDPAHAVREPGRAEARLPEAVALAPAAQDGGVRDRKSTRLNSSHLVISYAVFCLKKKKTQNRSRSVTNRSRTRRRAG